ncbi:hypothetical protein [Natronoarchaeum rubrum]|uniref:hypothetical protein n=1 Tax=Natronoarchaeum rubrum TaxID=755311 RepID=UPI0021129614|nr:hypothetical protein [Natronoarchaeum rubrum]
MSDGAEQEVPDGWVREELVAGMDTVGTLGYADEYVGMGGGYKCRHCSHYIPIESLDDDTCPLCETGGMIGTIIMGMQEVTALYPEGWFDDADQAGDQS